MTSSRHRAHSRLRPQLCDHLASWIPEFPPPQPPLLLVTYVCVYLPPLSSSPPLCPSTNSSLSVNQHSQAQQCRASDVHTTDFAKLQTNKMFRTKFSIEPACLRRFRRFPPPAPHTNAPTHGAPFKDKHEHGRPRASCLLSPTHDQPPSLRGQPLSTMSWFGNSEPEPPSGPSPMDLAKQEVDMYSDLFTK